MIRLIGSGTVVVLLSAASVTIPTPAPLPQAPEVHKLATTLRCSDDVPWTDPCIDFLYTYAPTDMHFVEETGAEISLDQALKNDAKTHSKPR